MKIREALILFEKLDPEEEIEILFKDSIVWKKFSKQQEKDSNRYNPERCSPEDR